MAPKAKEKEAATAMIRIQYYRSSISCPGTQKEIVRSLVERPDTPSMRGAVAKVPHLIRIIE